MSSSTPPKAGVKADRGVRRTLLSVIRQVDHVGEVTCLRTHPRATSPTASSTPQVTSGSTACTHATERGPTTTHTTTHTTYLFVGYSTGIVTVFSCSTFRAVWSAPVHDLDSSVIELHVIEDVLVTQSRAGEVSRWQIDWEGRRFLDGRRLDQARSGHASDDDFDRAYSFARMCCIPSGQCVAYPSRGGRVTVHNYQTDQAVDLETNKYGMVTSLSGTDILSPIERNEHVHGTMLVCVGYESGRVEVYDVRLGDGRENLVCEIPGPGADPCVALDCCAVSDGTSVSVARGFAGDGSKTDLDVHTSQSSPDMNPPLMHIGAISLEHGTHTTMYRYLHTASVMETPRGLTATLRGMDQIVFRQDGKYVAAACWDGKVRIYRVSTGKLVDVILPAQAKQASTCFAFEGQLLVVGSRDGTVSVWRLHEV